MLGKKFKISSNLIRKIRVAAMAHTKFEYVRSFETEDKLAPLNWIVLSVKCADHKEFLKKNKLEKESDILRDVMSSSAQKVMSEIKDICMGYGFSNAFNFVLQKDTLLYKRRGFKILSNVTSLFTSSFIAYWSKHYSKGPLLTLPMFDGSLYLFPQDQTLRDFLTKEQYDCHHINLEETTLKHLVNVTDMEYVEAQKRVRESNESERNEILFTICNINYNNEPVKKKKGTILLREGSISCKKLKSSIENKGQHSIYSVHTDFYRDDFWDVYFPLEQKTERSVRLSNFSAFKRHIQILPHTFLVIRVDGKGFHRFSELHNFNKPNDIRSLNLMTTAAQYVMKNYPKIKIAYGQSDEFSFVFTRFGHREKDGNSLISRIVSLFTAAYVFYWNNHFKDITMLSNPAFDARLVLYPTIPSLQDYLSWRQADCHINNMYNTCFWKLVNEKGLSRKDAEEYLKGTFSRDKLAILKNEFNLDYEKEEPLFRKGTVIYTYPTLQVDGFRTFVEHSDIIGDQFWIDHPLLIGDKTLSDKSEKQPTLIYDD